MRSLATRQSNLALSKYVKDAVNILKAAEYDLIILETSGIGQSDTEITEHSDLSLYVMTPEYGAATQLEKIDMLDFADFIALNKFDKRGALDALRDVRKQYKRNHLLWEVKDEELPIFGSIASQFNDAGTNALYKNIIDTMIERLKLGWKSSFNENTIATEKQFIIPPSRVRYLSEFSENNRRYDTWVNEQAEIAENLYGIDKTLKTLGQNSALSEDFTDTPPDPTKKVKVDAESIVLGIPKKEEQEPEDPNATPDHNEKVAENTDKTKPE